ncbi:MULTISPECIES: ANTAR domain-containing protein [Acinetobacter]|uniref:ANTAR domain-containing response regulator n=1 Tax=Acinetobacter TaxID=469 RepID=UPI00102049DA|nr:MULTISPECIES: ANTAR domain-containing protein [Acinetobacter]MDM1756009.1 ANTAR domain-containing protein [Acinetobacter sp. 256-1]MDM1760549.1 ANTAR domain-containing protein [Acinetobacter sp. 251-1]RYL28475.1 ANTAR domain-containing protein [Acinetobacter piscicola]
MSKLKIALIDDDSDRAEFVKKTLIEHQFEVVACLMTDQLDLFYLQQIHADVILLDMDHPHRDIIESCVSQFDLPTVLFTKNGHKETIKSAIEAGITAYIVDGIQPAKLDSILQIAIEQYKKHKKLTNDLKEAKTKLADRKDIDKAKVLLMNLHQINEENAFALLRKNAMSHRMTIGEMARRLIDAQALLQGHTKDEL